MTKQSQDAGARSWFGTLTLSSDQQLELLGRAMRKSGVPEAQWWGDVRCDHRFKLVADEFHSEVRKYFRRLRHRGAKFKYLLVYERHKSGLPHAHFILHEDGCTILKRTLKAEWLLGHTDMNLIGGRARSAASPEKAGWYAVKYLQKSSVARVKASPGYKPVKRSKTHRRKP